MLSVQQELRPTATEEAKLLAATLRLIDELLYVHIT